ncbi:MAG: hypothetical protein R3B70_40810 [Polyangiaceae bacterium]
MRTARPLAALLAVALCSVGSSREALAQAPAAKAPAAPSAPSADQIAKAKTLFDLGAKAYDSEQFPAAIQAFEEAYRLSARPGPIFSAAQAYRRLYNTDRKVDTLRKAIENYKPTSRSRRRAGASWRRSSRSGTWSRYQAGRRRPRATPSRRRRRLQPRTPSEDALMVSSSTKGRSPRSTAVSPRSCR